MHEDTSAPQSSSSSIAGGRGSWAAFWHILYVGVLGLWILAVLAFAIFTFVTNLGPGPSMAPQGSRGGGLDDPKLYVEFEAQQLQASGRRLDGVLRLTTPVREPVVAAHQMFELTIGAQDTASLSCGAFCTVFSTSIPISDLFNPLAQGRKTFAFPVSLPLDGSAANYPQDTYRLNMYLAISFPVGSHYSYYTNEPKGSKLAFSRGTLTEDFDVTNIKKESGQLGPSRRFRFLTLDFQRKPEFAFYIYSLCTIPVLFAFLFFHLLLLKQGSRELSLLDAMAALMVTTLAILPLRLVLVPSSIEGLTRVDLALGGGLLLILGVAVAKYAAHTLHELRSAADGPVPSEAIPEE